MNYGLIAGPVVGAIIGYCTNYIAVKMLFRPLEPVFIFGKKLPFTPGIIPKGKDRLAKAIGDAVGNNLLTEEALEKNLLSQEMKDKLRDKIDGQVALLKEDSRRVDQVVTQYIDQETYVEKSSRVERIIAEKVCKKLSDMDLGEMIASQANILIREFVSGSFFGRFINDDLIYSIVNPIRQKVDDLIETRGADIIENKLHEEVESINNKTVGEVIVYMENNGFNAGDAVVKMYSILIEKKLSSILKGINISKIIKDKIDEMGVMEVEEMVLSVMKKELNAIVNLGALIGFILGCVNIFFTI